MNCLKQAHILETGIKLKRKNNTKTWPQPNTWKRVHLLGQEQNSADLSSATQKYFYKANTFTWNSENSWALKMKKEKKWPDCDTSRRVYLLKQTKLTWSTSSNAKKYSNNAKLFHYNCHYLWAKVQYLCSTSCARTTTCCTVLPGWNGELIVFAVLGIKRLRHILWKPSFQTWQQQQTNRTFVLTGNSSIL